MYEWIRKEGKQISLLHNHSTFAIPYSEHCKQHQLHNNLGRKPLQPKPYQEIYYTTDYGRVVTQLAFYKDMSSSADGEERPETLIQILGCYEPGWHGTWYTQEKFPTKSQNWQLQNNINWSWSTNSVVRCLLRLRVASCSYSAATDSYCPLQHVEMISPVAQNTFVCPLKNPS